MWWLLLYDTPQLRDHFNHWQFSYSGDITTYLQMAQDLIQGAPKPVSVGAGWPLIWSGFMRVVGSTEYEPALPLVVIVNGGLLGALSVSVMGGLGYALSRSRWQSLCIAGLWTFLPYAMWIGFGLHSQAEILRNVYVPRQFWVLSLTDGPSFLFIALGMVLVLRGRQARRVGSLLTLLAGGVCIGFGIATRIHVATMAAPLIAAMVWNKEWRGVLLMVVGVLIGYAPQFWYSAVTTGHPLNVPYLKEWMYFERNGLFVFNPRYAHFSARSLFQNLALFVGRLPLMALAGLAGVIVSLAAFRRCWQKCGSVAAITMFGAPLMNYAIHVVTYSFTTDPVRFTLPALSIGLPAIVWTGAFGADEVIKRLSRLR